ncbi:cell wall hydrolase [Aromatoleum evansii]|uniref:cell wall hydrolase n=1 Tax=Aromatoleum evansii TaxID=59406 RepID=UPI00145D901D|nr:cell wall hydrolase [Aromatoleum evansii]NMG32504.1 hypothetical protein [Aromatoleum evansii]
MLARIDVLDGNGRTIAQGRVDQCEPAPLGKAAAFDAALVEIAPETARTLALAYDYLRPLGVGSDALSDRMSLVLQTGRGPIRGVLVGIHADFNVKTASDSTYTLRAVHTFRAAESTRPGDSGAAVWDESGRLVGIHCGGLEGDPSGLSNAFFCAIDPIVEAFGVRVLTRASVTELTPIPPPAPPDAVAPPINGERELDVVARTIWGEAGELGAEAMRAVAAVILNRRAYGKWMGGTALEVCLRPYQFRCWDASSPAIHRMRLPPADDPALQQARTIAQVALAGGIVPDPTGGATRYHPEWVMPVWAEQRQPSAPSIAGLRFYRVE